MQTSDTVVIYDPDANPKNEEQAIARSHRIGQRKPVRVVHLETVADAPPDALEVEDPDYDAAAAGERFFPAASVVPRSRGSLLLLSCSVLVR